MKREIIEIKWRKKNRKKIKKRGNERNEKVQ